MQLLSNGYLDVGVIIKCAYLLKLVPLQWRLCKWGEWGWGRVGGRKGRERERKKKKRDEEIQIVLIVVLFIFSQYIINKTL